MVMVVPSTPAQRGPGLASRQRRQRPGSAAHRAGTAQRGPGLASRQRATSARCSPRAARSLNEGRDSRPGNGQLPARSRAWRCDAQRGPGLASRQRAVQPDPRLSHMADRSTRAGTRVPATARRRTGRRCPAAALNEGRDSRPGNGRPHWPVLQAEARRSTRAGTRVPATGRTGRDQRRGTRALNEGRDSRPGNGVRPEPAGPAVRRRSTRAGTRVPATVVPQNPELSSSGLRSTRAGTRVPATGTRSGARRDGRGGALNEGRDSRPGNGGGAEVGLLELLGRSTRAGTRVPATGS